MARKFVLPLIALMVFALFTGTIFAKDKKQRLVNSDDYKEDDFVKTGVIDDYSDMVEGDDIEWVWVAPGFKLSDHKYQVEDMGNKSEVSAKSLPRKMKEALQDSLDNAGGKGSTVTVEGSIYWAEKSSEGKRWIPYAGGHLAQAGVGVELVLRDSSGKTVAKIRHSGREGSDIDDAAEEVSDDIREFVDGH